MEMEDEEERLEEKKEGTVALFPRESMVQHS